MKSPTISGCTTVVKLGSVRLIFIRCESVLRFPMGFPSFVYQPAACRKWHGVSNDVVWWCGGGGKCTLDPSTSHSLSQNDERAISTATPHAPQRVPLAGTVLAVARTKRDITALGEHETSGYNRKTMKRCWAFLDRTSRSFAAVIKELDGDLARVVGPFP